MESTITLVQDEDGMFITECAAVRRCVSQGRTEREAEETIQEAIRESLAVRAERGMPLTVQTRQIEVSV